MVCTICKEDLELTEFYTDIRRKNGYRPDCKKCHNKRQAERAQEWKAKPQNLTEKQCSLCLETKLIKEFNKDVRQQSGYTPRCRSCAKVGKKMYSKEYRKTYQAERRLYNLMVKFPEISKEQLKTLLDRSKLESCEICGERDENKDLCLDHHHSSNVVRGLLCHNCNVAIGHANDNPEQLRKMAAYLDRHPHGVL